MIHTPLSPMSLPSWEPDVHLSVLRRVMNSWEVQLGLKQVGMSHQWHSCKTFSKGLTQGSQCPIAFNTHIPLLSLILVCGHECIIQVGATVTLMDELLSRAATSTPTCWSCKTCSPCPRFKLFGFGAHGWLATALIKENLVQILIRALKERKGVLFVSQKQKQLRLLHSSTLVYSQSKHFTCTKRTLYYPNIITVLLSEAYEFKYRCILPGGTQSVLLSLLNPCRPNTNWMCAAHCK